MNKIIIASNNLDKSQELSDLFQYFGRTAVNYQSLHPRLRFPEEAADFRQNALQKARFIQTQLTGNVLILGDDSGLYLAAFPKKFGTFTHRQLQAAPFNHTQYLLKLLMNQKNRQIKLVSYLVLLTKSQVFTAHGELSGMVALTERGSAGFDLDRIVIPKGETQTLAQMAATRRRLFEQRYQAVKQLNTLLQQNL